MSRTMANIHQGTISDLGLINWITLYGIKGQSNVLATTKHREVAYNLFEKRAERVVMSEYGTGSNLLRMQTCESID